VYENSPDGTFRNFVEVEGNHVPAGKAVHVYGNSVTAASGANEVRVIENQLAGGLTVNNNTVEGGEDDYIVVALNSSPELKVNDNTLVAGPYESFIQVDVNTVTNTLACYSNAPTPVDNGFPNAAGRLKGQCSGLG
jgi:hypothetical protein